MKQTPTKLLYSRKSAAVAMEVCPRTVDAMIRNGVLDAVRCGHKVLITAESITRFCRGEKANTAASDEAHQAVSVI